MKIKQDKTIFKPVRISLETEHEADAFFMLMVSLEKHEAHANAGYPKLTHLQKVLLVKMANYHNEHEYE